MTSRATGFSLCRVEDGFFLGRAAKGRKSAGFPAGRSCYPDVRDNARCAGNIFVRRGGVRNWRKSAGSRQDISPRNRNIPSRDKIRSSYKDAPVWGRGKVYYFRHFRTFFFSSFLLSNISYRDSFSKWRRRRYYLTVIIHRYIRSPS